MNLKDCKNKMTGIKSKWRVCLCLSNKNNYIVKFKINILKLKFVTLFYINLLGKEIITKNKLLEFTV